MNCENNICLYNDEHGECMLDEVEINELGMCGECVRLSFSKEERNKKRKKMLKDFLERESENI